MGKTANRAKAAARKGEKLFTGNQRLEEAKSRHRQDMLALMATFDKVTTENEERHTADLAELKKTYEMKMAASVEKCTCKENHDRVVVRVTGLDD